MPEKIYAWLLKLYPARFREEYGASAMQLFRDRLHAERGFRERFRFWLDVLSDLAISVPREHCRRAAVHQQVVGFRLSGEALAVMYKRKMAALVIPFCVFGALGFTTGWLGNSAHVPLLVAYSFVAILGAKEFLSMGAFRKQWRSLELILGTDRIKQKRDGADLTILQSEVLRLIESSRGLLIVGGVWNRPRTIVVPAGLNGYQEVRNRLCEWLPITQQPELWFSDRGALGIGLVCILPAMLLVRSLSWLFILAIVFWGLILLEIMMNLARPLNSSWQPGPRRRGLGLAPPAHMWRRFKGQCRRTRGALMWAIRLALIALPIVRAVVARPH
jgi:hypothetical protein